MSSYSADFLWRGVKVRFVTNSRKAIEFVESGEFLQMGFARPFFSSFETVDATFRYNCTSEGSKFIRFERRKTELVLQCSWQDLHEILTLNELTFVLCEYVNQHRSQFCIHASAIEKNGRTVVMGGPRYSGKTTLAIEMCLRHDCRLIANDLVAIGLDNTNSPTIFEGANMSLNVRARSARSSNPQLFKRLFGGNFRIKSIRVSPEELDIETYLGSMPLRLDLIVLVRVDGNFKARLERVDSVGDIELLAELFTSWVRGVSIALCDQRERIAEIACPSLDSVKLHKNRARFINQLLDENRVFSVGGDLEGSLRILAELVDKPDRFRAFNSSNNC